MDESGASLSFCFVGLPAREQLVFKSLMRLLATRLRNEWVYLPQAQLLVIGDLPLSQEDILTCGAPSALAKLHVGTNLPDGAQNLCLPIKANILEERINALGKKILAARVNNSLAVAAHAEFEPRLHRTIMPADAPFATAALDTSQSFKLKRWPPSKLLNLQGRIRMATVLLRRVVSLQELSKYANQEEHVCKGFLAELWAADLLSAQTTKPPTADAIAVPQVLATPLSTPKTSLLSRIRLRLGL